MMPYRSLEIDGIAQKTYVVESIDQIVNEIRIKSTVIINVQLIITIRYMNLVNQQEVDITSMQTLIKLSLKISTFEW